MLWLWYFLDGLSLILNLLLNSPQDIKTVEDFCIVCGDVGNASIMDGHLD